MTKIDPYVLIILQTAGFSEDELSGVFDVDVRTVNDYLDCYTETPSASTAPTAVILRPGSKAVMPDEQGGAPQRYALPCSDFNGEIHARKGPDHRGGIR